MAYSNVEKRDMLKIYYKCDCNSRTAITAYETSFDYTANFNKSSFRNIKEGPCMYRTRRASHRTTAVNKNKNKCLIYYFINGGFIILLQFIRANNESQAVLSLTAPTFYFESESS